jgi:hypothetical protein
LPRASRLLRLLAFAVPAGLALAGIQPLLGAAAGGVHLTWSLGLSTPALGAALLLFAAARLSDRGDEVQPPWYAAWALLPGAFLLAGAAAMCIYGALVEFSLITGTMWVLLAAGTVLWSSAIVVVRRTSR